MKKIIAIVLTSISICLLTIYGVDVLLNNILDIQLLGSDHVIRGFVFGMPSIILPIIAYLLTKNTKIKKLGILFIINGGLIIIGGLAVFPTESAIKITKYLESLFLIGIGGIISYMGIKKITI